MSGLTASLLFFLSSPAHAQTVVDSPAADNAFLTIYPDDLAMITEVRRIQVPEGVSTIRLLGVSDQIISQTAVLQSFQGVTLERNFDSDLISKGALINGAVGEFLSVRRVNSATGHEDIRKAKLVSAPEDRTGFEYGNISVGGAVFEIDGKLEALQCAGLFETILFDDIPTELNPAPVLSLHVRAEEAGEKEISLTYLTQGLDWEADYRLNVDDTHTKGHLAGWLTIRNETSKSFKNVPTVIIAGTLNRSGDTGSDPIISAEFYPLCWPKGSTKTGIPIGDQVVVTGTRIGRSRLQNAAPMVMQEGFYGGAEDEIIVTATKRQATREDFGDYKLYRTPEPVTLSAYQTKQIAFLDAPEVETERLFKFDFDVDVLMDETPSLESADVEYEIDNSHNGNLAKPLPRGTIRVMSQRNNGKTAYLGENRVNDLAVGLPVEIAISESSAVQMRPSLIPVTTESTPLLRLSTSISNATPEPITAEVKITGDDIRADNIGTESHPRDPEEIVPTYILSVPAESRQTLTLDLPVERTYRIEREEIYYSNDEPGDTDTESAYAEYRLKGQVGGEDWASDYFDDFDASLVRVGATLLKYKEFTNSDDEDFVRITERLEFFNNSDAPAKIRFVFPDPYDEPVTFIKASISPVYTEPLTWIFTVQSGQSKSLTLTFEGEE